MLVYERKRNSCVKDNSDECQSTENRYKLMQVGSIEISTKIAPGGLVHISCEICVLLISVVN